MQEAVSAKINQLAEELDGLPEDLRPFVGSIIITRFAADYEAKHNGPASHTAWAAHGQLMEKELQNPDKEAVFERAVLLATLPKHENEQVEWVYRWLRGGGFATMLELEHRDRLIALLDDPQKGARLARALDDHLSIDVANVTTLNDLWEPEPFNLLVALLTCSNFESNDPRAPMSPIRQQLFDKAMRRSEESVVKHAMGLFENDEQTRDLYLKFKRWQEWEHY